MSKLQTGLYLYSVRKAMVHDYMGTIEKVAGLGYKNIELSFESPHLARFDVPCPAAELRAATEKLGLTIVSSHVVYHSYLDWDEVIAYLKEAGCQGITIPMYLYNLSLTRSRSEEAYYFSEILNKLGQKCADNGLTFHYHNFYNEFEQYDGKYIFDILLENTDPDLVNFEFDIYWATRGGVDPVQWMDKLGSRIKIIQVQDLEKDAKNLNLVEVDGSFDNAFYPKIHTHHGDYTEIGNGLIDFERVFAKAKTMESLEYVMVAQTECGSKSELQSAAENLATLKRML
ncbi:MAG: sugar phosphate isomerase/epimerase family protein [Saccharofermentanales bacterium]|nr:sugar phosphate isomerase/epimerase [Clostridiaceae bacterium]